MMERRFIKSGVSGLDELLGGGILEGSIITVSGPTGSGKSALAAQFICNGALQSDEPGVYIAIEESKRDFMFHMSGFGFDFESLEKERKFIFLDYPVHEVDQIINQSNAIFEIIRNTGAKRVVIDSIMPIALFFRSDDERKKGFLKFIENLRKWNATIIIVSEDLKLSNQQGSPSSEYGIESFTDGWINLFYRYDDKSMERKRFLEVIKMKGASHSSRSVPVALSSDGLSVLTEAAAEPPRKAPQAPAPAEARPVKPVEDEEIEKLVESVFAPKPKAAQPQEARPAPQKAQNPPPEMPEKRAAEPKLKRLSGPGGIAMLSARGPAPAKPQPEAAPMPRAQAPKAPSAKAAQQRPSAAPRAPQSKPPPTAAPPKAREAPPKAAAPKAPQGRMLSPGANGPRTAKQPATGVQGKPPSPPPAAAPKMIAKEAPKAKAAPKPPAPSPKKEAMARLLAPAPERSAPQARPAPAKMSDSIAQRIAEAKKKIMKKG